MARNIWGVFVIAIFIVSGHCQKKDFEINLETTWKKTSFPLTLIESIAAHNESLFLTVVGEVLGCNIGDESYKEFGQLDSGSFSDENFYKKTMRSLHLNDVEKSIINFNLVNKIYSPRIAAHYKHYDELSKNGRLDRLYEKCGFDSLGQKLRKDKPGTLDTWIQHDDQVYCTFDGSGAFESIKPSKNIEVLPFDRVIGTNDASPYVVVYGKYDSPIFRQTLKKLYESAKQGKVRFSWRYIPPLSAAFDQLGGYAVDFSLKEGDFVLDSENYKKNKRSNRPNTSLLYDIRSDFSQILELDDIKFMSKDSLELLSLKLTNLVLSNNYNNVSDFEFLRTILVQFPKFAPYIADLPKLLDEKTMEAISYNEKLGISEESFGIYINGAPVDKSELDMFTLFDKVEEERRIVMELVNLGFNTEQVKKLITKFALIKGVKENQYLSGKSILGKNKNRFKVYSHKFTPGKLLKRGGVVFFNNIENDKNYELFSSDRKETYNDIGDLRLGQIPVLRENVHDIIFAINLADKEKLRDFITLASRFLDVNFPIQVGILPLIYDAKSLYLTRSFFFHVETESVRKGLSFLLRYLVAEEAEEQKSVFPKVPRNYNFLEDYHKDVAERYAILTPSVIINGVIRNMFFDDWKSSIRNQVAYDVMLIKQFVENGLDIGKKLKDLLYEGARTSRNLRIIPADFSYVNYKFISENFFGHSLKIRRKDIPVNARAPLFWIIGDFSLPDTIRQFLEVLKVMKKYDHSAIQLRVLSTTKGTVLDRIRRKKLFGDLNEKQFQNLLKLAETYTTGHNDGIPDESVLTLLKNNILPLKHSFLLLNSRYFRIDTPLFLEDLDQLIGFEVDERLDIISGVISNYPEDFFWKSLKELKNERYDYSDWFDLVSNVLTKSFVKNRNANGLELGRFDFSSLNMNNMISSSVTPKEVEILLFVQPISKFAQKAISLLNSVRDLPFVSIKVLLQPNVKQTNELGITSFYLDLYASPAPSFEANGLYKEKEGIVFKLIPQRQNFLTYLETPKRWLVVAKDVPEAIDMNFLHVGGMSSDLLYVTYELKSIMVEGYATDISIGRPPKDAAIQSIQDDHLSETVIMQNFGYFQLPATAGSIQFGLRKNDDERSNYLLLSATENIFEINDVPLSTISLPVFKLTGSRLRPRLSRTSKGDFALSDTNKDKKKQWHFDVQKTIPHIRKQAEINVFALASGRDYERLVQIMMLSVRKHTSSLVKFWILENYLSPQFKNSLPLLASNFDFQYELVSYVWPSWLRKQGSDRRMIWAYKTLFLDVLFPRDLSKVIFVDADQIVRADLKELLQINLQGSPFALVPMCNSRQDMVNYRFWEKGYWKKVLKDDFNYHISALFVADLEKLRELDGSDRLRSHYQLLSSYSFSLDNLDQDLLNNFQKQLPIYSLPQEWLWCETWCSSETLPQAKAIDLCNNPLSKDGKLQRGMKTIPEWAIYDREIRTFLASEARQEKLNLLEASKNQRNRKTSSHIATSTNFKALHDEL